MMTPSRIARELSTPVNALLGCAGLRIERSSSPRGRAFSSGDYWERRYAVGGTSGAGSYGRLARFKAEVLNELIVRHDIRTLIEWGCGDGHQSSLLEVDDYLGVDGSTILASVPAEHLGVVGAFMNLTRNIGNVVGQALAAAIVVGVMAGRGFDVPLSAIASTEGATEAFLHGSRIAYALVTILSMLALVLALFTKPPRNSVQMM